jgi:hypothetical protein
LISLLRNGRARIALATALFSLTLPAAAHAAAGDAPDLVQGSPYGIAGDFFDDHSIAGDDHRAWTASPVSEPFAIKFRSQLSNVGAGVFELCGYRVGATSWMRAYQEFPAALGSGCQNTEPASGQRGWFRYAPANHAVAGTDPPVYLFNRWHVMDVQRFALVALPASAGGPGTTVPTVWDTRWGACLGLSADFLDCELSQGAPPQPLDVGLSSGTTKVMQDGAPDDEVIAIPPDLRAQLPDGTYQIVAIANPYGRWLEAGTGTNVNCSTIRMSSTTSGITVSTLDAAPTTCWVPQTLPGEQNGGASGDPLTGAQTTDPACPVSAVWFHCWPSATPPTDLSYPAAATNATGTPTAWNAVPVQVRATSVPAPSTPTPATPSTGGQGTTTRTLTARVSRTYARTALRKQFGRNLSRLVVSCRVRSSTASTCTVSFRKSGGRYSGHVWLRYRTVNSRLRWQYRVEIKKRKSGRTQTIRRSYRTGGTF